MNRISSGNNGFGLEPAPAEPTNPVTPGVVRHTYQGSAVITSATGT